MQLGREEGIEGRGEEGGGIRKGRDGKRMGCGGAIHPVLGLEPKYAASCKVSG